LFVDAGLIFTAKSAKAAKAGVFNHGFHGFDLDKTADLETDSGFRKSIRGIRVIRG
jgi:hypothetical protein